MRHTIGALAALAVLGVLGAAVVGGCGGATTAQPASPSPSASPPTASPSAPPAAPGDFTGAVRDLRWSTTGPRVLLVVADDPATGQVGRAWVTVMPATAVWTVKGRRGDAGDLKRGEVVAVWFAGPVAESYPAQAKAGAIRILHSN
jgi:hypothetical protein